MKKVVAARALHAIRTSRERHPAAVFDEARMALLPATQRLDLQLLFHFTRGHLNDALQLVETANASDLTTPDIYLIARQVLADAGKADEVTLIDESMAGTLKRALPDFWLFPNNITARQWFDVASAVKEPTSFPAAWFNRAIESAESPLRQNELRLRQAWLLQDWKRVRDAADHVLTEAPDLYDTYYDRAIARHETGNDAGAREDLRVFLHYCLSNDHYQHAVALFRQLAPQERIELPE